MIAKRNIDLNNLITISSNGVDVASFVDLKTALIKRYKDIYGQDIDVSTGNADGEFINEIALMVNNILQSIKTLYSNMNVNSATGVYLYALCNLSNVRRKDATNSTASIILTNNSGSTYSENAYNITLQDQGGTIWNIINADTIEIAAGASIGVKVECSEKGEVEAPAGWINILVGNPDI